MEALINFLREKERKNTSEDKKKRKIKIARLPGRVLNSRPSCFFSFLIQYTNALS